MAGEGPHLAVDNTPDPEESGPTNGSGENGRKLRSDFHQLELGMERLRSDVVTNLAAHKIDNADISAKIAEAKVSIITIILIAIGVAFAFLGALMALVAMFLGDSPTPTVIITSSPAAVTPAPANPAAPETTGLPDGQEAKPPGDEAMEPG